MEIYFYDKETGKYAGFTDVPDVVLNEDGQEQEYVLPDNATKTEPDWSLLDLYWDGESWKGVSQDEYDKNHTSKPPEGWVDTPSELEKLKERQDATEQALQDLILSQMSTD